MLIGQTNFATHHYIFQRKWNVVWRNAEIRSTLVVLLLSLPVMFFFVTVPIYSKTPFDFSSIFQMQPAYAETGGAFRRAAFESISALTGTGFSTVSYPSWSSLGIFLIIILMCAGGHTNSTSGGIKQLRLYLIFKSIYWMIRDQFLPKSSVVSNFVYKGENRLYVNPKHIQELVNYVVVYILTLLAGSAILMGVGFPMKASLFEFASALGTVGLSYGITSYSSSATVLITEIAGMFLGRLEFFVIFYCIIKIFRDAGILMSREN